MDVLRFDQVYPGWYYAPGRWETIDGYVPWTVFWLLYEAMPRVIAQRQLDESGGVALGIGIALANQLEADRLLRTFKQEMGLSDG